MDPRLPGEKGMTKRPYIELVRHGTYVAEVSVELIETNEG